MTLLSIVVTRQFCADALKHFVRCELKVVSALQRTVLTGLRTTNRFESCQS